MTIENALQLFTATYLLIGLIFALAWVMSPKTRKKTNVVIGAISMLVIIALWPVGIESLFRKRR